MAQGIEVQSSVLYVHTQNSLTESLIKRIKLIARPLLQGCNLSTSCWGHTIIHVTDLVQLRPTAYHTTPTPTCTWRSTKYLPFAEI
jgi:hypothetical protein